MTDTEFDILDEMYFVTSYHELSGSLDLDNVVLNTHLKTLFNKGWIRVLTSPEEELFGGPDWTDSIDHLYFLASKKGLLAHNSDEDG